MMQFASEGQVGKTPFVAIFPTNYQDRPRIAVGKIVKNSVLPTQWGRGEMHYNFL